jgi:hypothetical protein
LLVCTQSFHFASSSQLTYFQYSESGFEGLSVEEAFLSEGDGCTSDQKFLNVTFRLSDAAQIIFRGEKLDWWFLNINF